MEDNNHVKIKEKNVPSHNPTHSLNPEIRRKIKVKLMSIFHNIKEKRYLMRLALAFKKWRENCNLGESEKKKKKIIKKIKKKIPKNDSEKKNPDIIKENKKDKLINVKNSTVKAENNKEKKENKKDGEKSEKMKKFVKKKTKPKTQHVSNEESNNEYSDNYNENQLAFSTKENYLQRYEN